MIDAWTPVAQQSIPLAAVKRVLIVSAQIGEGHNATGRALEQAVRRLWPDAEVRWVDTFTVMGPGTGPAFRGIYVANVQATPWLYEFFFALLWRWRWFASASKRFVGRWVGPRLARVIDETRPDLIISTYPLGTAGLTWLRRRGRLDAPAGAWVSDFCPHPFWVFAGVDVTYVMDDNGVDVARRAEPTACVRVGALPVADGFVPGDRTAARRRLGLDPSAFVALLSTGSFGFGSVDRAVRTLVGADPRVEVVAVCGNNARLRRELAGLGLPRLRVLGWVDEMALWMTACDLVVTNAGGMTALEAVACGRPVVMFEPIAAHGRANAALMARSGLAVLCPTVTDLAREVRRLVADPDHYRTLGRAALARARQGRRENDLVLLAGCRSAATRNQTATSRSGTSSAAGALGKSVGVSEEDTENCRPATT